jgi:uncharacterized protein (TIGR02270 family)
MRAAVEGVAVIGDPALVPWLLTIAEKEEHARVAAEAVRRISGITIEGRLAKGRGPSARRPNDDPADTDVAMDPDEALPWPNVEALRASWTARRGSFRDGVSYLLGKERTGAWLEDVLRSGPQACRALAALELTLQDKRPLFEVRARATVA